MIKSLNSLLLQQLIDSDFVFCKTVTKNLQIEKDSNIYLNNKIYFNVLNIFELNKNVKQFIRILQFLCAHDLNSQLKSKSAHSYLLEKYRKLELSRYYKQGKVRKLKIYDKKMHFYSAEINKYINKNKYFIHI
jgi:hypothetical protein